MADYTYDLIIIGAGPGGYEAAFEAAKFGMKTALIEKDHVGGTCLNRGCIPTKAIMRSSELARAARDGAQIGVTTGDICVDLDGVRARKNDVIATLRDGIHAGIKKNKIDFFCGTGTVVDPHTVQVLLTGDEAEENAMLTGRFLLLATGGSPVIPPIPGAALEGVIDSTALLEKGGTPFDDLVIIGGGVIGVEFATIYRDFGSRVTIIEALDRLIPNMDKELGRSLKMSMQKDGIEIYTKCPVARIEEADGRLRVIYRDKDEERAVPADAVLMAVGRRADTSGLLAGDLRHLLDERGVLKTDENGCTEIPSIYAIGDAAGGIQLAHVATAEGRNAVAHMNGAAKTVRPETVPSCIYSMPEIASVGLTADEAKEQGIAVVTKKYAMGANGKTVIEDLGRGFLKLVAREDDHRLIGAQLMCGRATDLVGELSLAIANGLTTEDIAATIHPHPTFVEAIAEAAR